METLEERFPFLFNTQADYNTNSKSYYDQLAKYNKVLQILSKMIEEYDEKLDNSLENINTVLTNYTTMLDGKLAGFDDSVMLLLREWIDDGTFEMIINTEIFNHKLDTTTFNAYKENADSVALSFSQQLAQKVGGGKLATIGDLGQDIKEAMTGGSVAVVGIDGVLNDNVADNQIGANKTNFLSQKYPNLFNKDDVNNVPESTINSSGVVVAGAGFTVSDFIAVTSGKEYYFKNVKFVVEFGLNQAFILRNAYNSSGIGSVVLNTATKFVRLVGVTANISLQFFSRTNEYLAFGAAHAITANENADGVKFTDLLNLKASEQAAEFMNGYFFNDRNIYTTVGALDGKTINGSTGAIMDNVNYFVTDFIPVAQFTHYYADFYDYATVALYTGSKVFVERKVWDTKEFDTTEAEWIRVTGKIVNKNKYHISLYPTNPDYNDSFKEEIKNIVAETTSSGNPVITFVDDDGYTEFLTKVKPVFDGASIKCAVGVVTDWVGTTNFMTVAQLQQLKTEGYNIVSHSSNHANTLYKKADFELLDNMDTLYETDMNKSLNFLQKNNLDTDILIYPYGWFSGTNVEKMMIRNAQKYYKYAVDNGNTYETTKAVKPQMIKRIFIRDANGLAYYQGLIDAVKINPDALLVFGTHSGLSELTSAFLQQVVDYVVSSGVRVLSPMDAFAEKIG